MMLLACLEQHGCRWFTPCLWCGGPVASFSMYVWACPAKASSTTLLAFFTFSHARARVFSYIKKVKATKPERDNPLPLSSQHCLQPAPPLHATGQSWSMAMPSYSFSRMYLLPIKSWGDARRVGKGRQAETRYSGFSQ